MNSDAPYSGLRVLDHSGALGAYASMLLGAMGAEVVLLESPQGSDLRTRQPLAPGTSESLAFAYYARGARSVTLDWARPQSLPLLESLASTADVVLLAPDGGTIPGLRFHEGNPSVSWCSEDNVVVCLSHFGLRGPWSSLRSTPLVSFALSGQMWRLGAPDQPPPAPPAPQIYEQLALYGLAGALIGLRERPAVGGQVVEVSLHEVLAATDGQLTRYASTTKFAARKATRVGAAPSGVWPVRGGMVELMVHNPSQWRGFVRALGSPAEFNDPTLEEREVRYQREDWLAARVAARLSAVDLHGFLARCEAERVPIAPYARPADFVEDEQPAIRDFWKEIKLPGGQTVRVPGFPWQSAPDTFGDPSAAPPTLGHDTEAIFIDELGYTKQDLAVWRAHGLL